MLRNSSGCKVLLCVVTLFSIHLNAWAAEPLVSTATSAKIRAAQHQRLDPAITSLEAHLAETKIIVSDLNPESTSSVHRTERRLDNKRTLRNEHTSAAAAKSVQISNLKSRFYERIDQRIQRLNRSGDFQDEQALRVYRAQVKRRFDDLRGDLETLAERDSAQFDERIRSVSAKLNQWSQGRPKENISEAAWGEAAALPDVELPRASLPPKFVSDAMRIYAAREGLIKTAVAELPSHANTCDYARIDLDPTPEAPSKNPEIVALAAQLGHDPLRIFEWVSNNVTYEPYFGSMKGGLATLQGRSGGATDQSSLLIALLRASNIPSRYVRGTVAVMDNSSLGIDGRGPRWIGAKSYSGAVQILKKNGNPSAAIQSSKGIKLAHVWVEVCIPYGLYRGAAIDKTGYRWVPLDPSYKEHSYSPGNPVDASFEFDYQDWMASRLDSEGRYRLPHEALADQALAYVRSITPGRNISLADLPYKSRIEPRKYEILPITPPYEVMSYDSWTGVSGGSAETAALPFNHRYRLEVTVRNKRSSGGEEDYSGNILFRKEINLSDVATQRLTLAFRGSTAAQNSVFTDWIKLVDPEDAPVCATTINMVPVLRLEGVELSKDTGSGSTTLCPGSTNNYTVLQLVVRLPELTANGGLINSANFASISAASIHAIHAYAWHTSEQYLSARSAKLLKAVQENSSDLNFDEYVRDETEGEFLNIAATKYSHNVAESSKFIGGIFNESGIRSVGLGIASGQVKSTYLFDLPYGLFRKGFLIDWPANLYAGSNLTQPTNSDFRAYKLTSFAASAYEAFVWQELVNLDALSTTRGMQFANELGIDILQINSSIEWGGQKCKLTNSCSDSALNTNPPGTSYSAYQVSMIEGAFATKGFKLSIPRQQIIYPANIPGAWKGMIFYAEKLSSTQTSSLSFPILAYAGGITIEPTSEYPTGSWYYGGVAGNNRPSGSAYIPAPTGGAGSTLGTGTIADSGAPTVVQQSGTNSYQTANGIRGATTSGDPVNMVTGNLVHSERDVSIKGPGGFPLSLERWYNSRSPKDGPFGYGWTHSFNQYIKFFGVENGVAKLVWVDGTGGERYYSTSDHSSGNIPLGLRLDGPDGIGAVFLRNADGTYSITESNGLKYVFENVSPGASDSGLKSRLLFVSDRNGNRMSLHYDVACGGNLCKVTDGTGRGLRFDYIGGRISQIKDWSGRRWSYSYSQVGDLVSYKNPRATNGAQYGVTYQYFGEIDGESRNHALKRYILPRGNGMYFEYYSNGRVFRHTPFQSDSGLRNDASTTFVWTEFRREVRQFDAQGNDKTFLFDPYGNPLSITDEIGGRRDYTYYTEPGRTHLRKTSSTPDGLVTTYRYDNDGNTTEIVLPSGNTEQYFDHNVFGAPRRVKNSNDVWTLLHYDQRGNVIDRIVFRHGVIPALNASIVASDVVSWSKMKYDTHGNNVSMKRLRDWSGAALGTDGGIGPSVESVYDSYGLNRILFLRRGDLDGNPTTIEAQRFTDFQYDDLGRMTKGPDESWYANEFGYNELDQLVSVPDEAGGVWSIQYDPNGNRVSRTLRAGSTVLETSTYELDYFENRISEINSSGSVTRKSYDALGNTISIVSADEYETTILRDAVGQIVKVRNAGGGEQSIVRGSSGEPLREIDEVGLVTDYEYFGSAYDGRLRRVILPKVTSQAGSRTKEVLAYDGEGRVLHYGDVSANGVVRDTYNFYDEIGRLVKKVGPQVNPPGDSSRTVQCYVYSRLSDLIELWAGAGTEADTTSRECDTVGGGLKRQFQASFDDFGRRWKQVDSLGNLSTWAWGMHNELVRNATPEQSASSKFTSFEYGRKGFSGESEGHLRSWSSSGDFNVMLDRNSRGRVTGTRVTGAGGAPIVTYQYQYDSHGNLAGVTDQRAGEIPVSQLNYRWSSGGRLLQQSDANGNLTSFSYDSAGRVGAISAPNGTQTEYVWDAAGRLIERRLDGNYVTTQSWFEDGGLKSRTNKLGATTLSNHTYGIDDFGRRSSQTELIKSTSKAWTYSYDRLDRLLAVGGSGSEINSYDIYGNRLSQTTASGVVVYRYDDAHRLLETRQSNYEGTLLSAYYYNRNGEVSTFCTSGSSGAVTKQLDDCGASGATGSKSVLGWDDLGRLTSFARTGSGALLESYQYDDSGRRLRKTSGSIFVDYFYDDDEVIAEVTGPLNAQSRSIYVGGVGTDEVLIRLTAGTNGQFSEKVAYVLDGIGSAVGALAPADTSLQSNQRFDVWGNRTSQSGTVPFYGYAGRIPDVTGLVNYRARYYLPSIGRFVSRDPKGTLDSISPYPYVGNDPVNGTDPTGEGKVVSRTIKSAAVSLEARTLVNAKRRAIEAAWRMEKQLIKAGKDGSVEWTDSQKKELLEFGRVKGYDGHHIFNAKHNRSLAGNQSNIVFMSKADHIDLHSANGGTHKPTSGKLIDRTDGGRLPLLADKDGYAIKAAALGFVASLASGAASAAEFVETYSPSSVFTINDTGGCNENGLCGDTMDGFRAMQAQGLRSTSQGISPTYTGSSSGELLRGEK